MGARQPATSLPLTSASASANITTNTNTNTQLTCGTIKSARRPPTGNSSSSNNRGNGRDYHRDTRRVSCRASSPSWPTAAAGSSQGTTAPTNVFIYFSTNLKNVCPPRLRWKITTFCYVFSSESLIFHYFL